MKPVRYGDLLFQSDMLFARRDDGTSLRLSRQERALLLRLVRQPHRLVTRAQLLAELGDLDGAIGERNIDYLVNRLRNRLGDSARNPRFIATQYGEGYVWLVEPEVSEPVSAFLLLGPVFGFDPQSRALDHALKRLTATVSAALGGHRKVVCLPDWKRDKASADAIDYSLETSLYEDGERIHMALVLHEGTTGTSISSLRITLARPSDQMELDDVAQKLSRAIWSHAALPNGKAPKPTDRPLHLRLHDAGALFTGDKLDSWRENGVRLAQAHLDNPDDPQIAVLLALNHYTRLLLEPFSGGGPFDATQWSATEDEIERLTLGALSRANGDPMILFGIAKLLRFVDRGYLQLAERLTEEAFQASTAFAAAFAMKGQIAASHGDLDGSLVLYDRAIELTEAETQFHRYLMFMKGVSLMAANRRNAVEHLATELYDSDPNARITIGALFLSPKARQVPAAIQPAIAAVPTEKARDLLSHFYRVSVRQFANKRHQKNILHGAAIHLADRHGSAVIPPDLQKRFPGLLVRPK